MRGTCLKLICYGLLLLPSTFVYGQGDLPLKVFVLVGQSNMEGHGIITPTQNHLDRSGGQGTLDYMVENIPDWEFLVDGNADYVVRDDVWYYYLRGGTEEVKGDLTAGFGANDSRVGPELAFGHVIGDHFENQVLLIKTAWGGKSLGGDFRPPSSGGTTGSYYNDVISIVNDVLDNLGTHFSEYNNRGYELVGLGWHQGWNDGGDEAFRAEYEENMVNYIKDVRVSFAIENLPFVIGTSGFGGHEENPAGGIWMKWLQNEVAPAQIAATDPDVYPEFEGNATTVNTWDYWRNDSISPAESVHHWNLNAESYSLIGRGMAEAMIGLLAAQGIPGCMDPQYQEFDSTATVPDTSACITLGVISDFKRHTLIQVFKGGLKINVNTAGLHSVRIHDITGRLAYSRRGAGANTYTYAPLATGIVLVSVGSEAGTLRKKVYLP